MAKRDWQLLEEAFAQASDLSADEQDRFVDRFGQQHAKLVDQLRSLLAADRNGETGLSGSIESVTASLTQGVDSRWKGRTIGPWTIVDRIADGGMGAVFRARRSDDEYEQTVAIKVTASRFPSDEAVARFRTERQILANLNHPNVAKLVDGGTTEDDQPYIAMEYVDGLPIDQYCDAQSLTLNERLRLFVKICTAVDYAHRNLIVHRDLKPSNVLVDADGEPKLLDFGIAKLLGQENNPSESQLTRFGIRPMTPEYASPEQVRGETPTVATDVYALGVLLFRLLTGRSPYATTNTSSAHEVEKAILESEPVRPSAVETHALADDAKKREGPILQYRKFLAGDLDNIVLKALHKQQQERYPSALALAEDINRYLNLQPVHARGSDWTYLLSKFIRRNRLGVSLAVLFALSMAALSSFYTFQLKQQRDLAQTEADKATQVAGFMRDLFRSADPNETLGRSISADQILARGAERIDDELSDQPEIRAAMMHLIGDIYRELDVMDKAEPLLMESLRMRRELLGENHPDTADTAHQVGVMLTDQRQFSAAETYLRQSLAIHTENLGDSHPKALFVASDLAIALYFQNRYDEASPIFEKAMMLRDAPEGQSEEFMVVLSHYGILSRAKGEYAKSEGLLRDALRLSRDLFGDVHAQVSNNMFNLAQLLELTADYEKSENFYRESLELDRQILGEKHTYVATGKTNLARLLVQRDELDEAGKLFREAIALRREIVDGDHPDLATDYYYYAHLLEKTGEPYAAEEMLLESLRIRRSVFDAHRGIGDSLMGLGNINLLLRNTDAAFRYLAEAEAMYEQTVGRESREMASLAYHMAKAYRSSRELDRAESYARESVALFTQLFNASHPVTIRSQVLSAGVLLDAGRQTECADVARDVKAKVEQAPSRYNFVSVGSIDELIENCGGLAR